MQEILSNKRLLAATGYSIIYYKNFNSFITKRYEKFLKSFAHRKELPRRYVEGPCQPGFVELSSFLLKIFATSQKFLSSRFTFLNISCSKGHLLFKFSLDTLQKKTKNSYISNSFVFLSTTRQFECSYFLQTPRKKTMQNEETNDKTKSNKNL